jgi:hypothetical protein
MPGAQPTYQLEVSTKRLSLLALATVCSVSLVACDTSRVTEPAAAAESSPLFSAADGSTNTTGKYLEGTLRNPCGESPISYQGWVESVTGTITAKLFPTNVTIVGEIKTRELSATVDGQSFKAPSVIPFRATFTRLAITYNIQVNVPLSLDGTNTTVNATVTTTVSSTGQITGVAVTAVSGVSCPT